MRTIWSQMEKTAPDQVVKGMTFFDESNPRSLISLLPPLIGKQVRLLWKSDDGYLLGLSEYDLFKELRRKGRQPQAVDNMLRVKFWLEYDKCQEMGLPFMVMSNVTARLMAKEMFHKYFLTDPKRLAWMLCPSTDYKASMEEALSFGVLKMRQLFEDTDFSGAKDLGKFLSAFRLLDERLHGARTFPGKRAAAVGGQGPVEQGERDEVGEGIANTVEQEIQERELRVAKLRLKIEKQGGTT